MATPIPEDSEMFWKLLALDELGWLWTALAGSGVLFGRLWKVQDCLGRLLQALASFPWLWRSQARTQECSTCFGTGSGNGSGMLWMALDGSGWGLGSFGKQSDACSQLAECQKSCSRQWWESYFVKSMLSIAETCLLSKIAKSRPHHWREQDFQHSARLGLLLCARLEMQKSCSHRW